MDKVDVIPYKREHQTQGECAVKEKKWISFSMTKDMIILGSIAFLLGRANVLHGLAPFTIAFYMILFMKDSKYAYIGVFSLLGMLTNHGDINIPKYCIAIGMTFITFRFVRERFKFKVLSIALFSSLIMFISGCVYIIATEFYVYDLLMELFESVIIFVFAYILNYALPIFIRKTNRNILSNEELICVAILAAVVVSGFSNIKILGLRIENVFGLLLTLIFAYNGGASVGAAVGITIGIITSMSSVGTPIVISIYGFSGLLAGTFKDLGKVCSAIGMILGNAILTFYINGSTEVIIHLEEIGVAFVLFLIMPKAFSEYIQKFMNFHISQLDKGYYNRLKGMMHEQLEEYSQAFSELAVTYGSISEKEKIVDQDDVTNIIEDVVEKTCKACGMCRSCWKNNFYNTYADVSEILTYLESYGRISADQIPDTLKKRCIKLEILLETIHSRFDVYKVDFEWQKKQFESRQLVAEQLKGVSEIIGNLSTEMKVEVDFQPEVEDALYVALDKIGVGVENITVLEMANNKFEIQIDKKGIIDTQRWLDEVTPVISKVIGKEVVQKKGQPIVDEDSDLCTITLGEAEKYKVATGVSRVAKDRQGICGDSYSYLHLHQGRYMMALSDGMGSGEKASKESEATISVLEQLMEAGFDQNVAIRTINSILLLKSSDETFSTMDLSLIDLYTGSVEFIKIGSAPTFIKRSSGDVEIIQSTSLPIGILDNVDIESFGQRIHKGDFIIMMSDGITDAEENEEEKQHWIVETLKSIENRNPQYIADTLLDIAIAKYHNKIKDDMTVMVSKIWE